jgi:hypothetical protein
MKKIIMMVQVMLLSSVAFAADIGGDLAGNFTGKWTTENGKRVRVSMSVRKLQDREGSYLALIMRKTKKVAVYTIDPIDGTARTRFSMVPLKITNTGDVVWSSFDPSLVLQVGADQKTLTIDSANSANKSGFSGFMTFKADNSPRFEWLDGAAGKYKVTRKQYMTVSPIVDGEAMAMSTIPAYSGSMMFRERLSGVFTVQPISQLSSGSIVSNDIKFYGVFVKNYAGINSTELLLLTPGTNDVSALLEK